MKQRLLRHNMTAEQHAVVPTLSRPERAACLLALSDHRFDPQRLAAPIRRLIRSAPEYHSLLRAAQAGADPFADGIPRPAVLLDEPVVLAALPRMTFCSPELERILTMLRRGVLLRATLGRVPSLDAEPLPRPFLGALAGAAFLAEYAWRVESDESERVAVVQLMLGDALVCPDRQLQHTEDLILLAALYHPLGDLPCADLLAAMPTDRWSKVVKGVIHEQVIEPHMERGLAEQLPALTPISDPTSRMVRAMYEEHPYPRWRGISFTGVERLENHFRRLCPGESVPSWPTPLPVLVAGAGTGRHPIGTARRFPNADVLAVDLSRTSLGYGVRMADRLGVRNVRFGQADILELDVLAERFALIECSGVLHHLSDPLAGWQMLKRLLRPDGLMYIALYSERGRSGILAARELLVREGVTPTLDGIRAARRRLLDLPPDDPAAIPIHTGDFYSASGFRDMMMHVQEHRFTIPELAAALDRLRLRFLGFAVPAETAAHFRARFPGSDAGKDLSLWDRFETDEPDTFFLMYHFWCRPC